MSTEIRHLLSDEKLLIEVCQPVFNQIDSENSGFIDEKELFDVMTKTSESIKSRPPTIDQVQRVMQSIDKSQEGKISFDEYIELIKLLLRDTLEHDHQPEENNNSKKVEEQINKQLQMFEKYLEESGITMAFQLIFAEILTKKIEPGNVFTYTAMRLRQIGKEIAHLLPKSLTANITET
jgi:Ca2+-binding EF-hand superfamily protein